MSSADKPPRLFLPVSSRPRSGPRPIAGQYITYENLTGTRSSLSELTGLLATLKRSDAVRWSAALLQAVSGKDATEPGLQMALAREFLDDKLIDAVNREAKAIDRWAVFHRRQVWLFLQLSLIVCRETTPSVEGRTAPRTVGTACLMVSDLLGQIEQHSIGPPKDGAGLEWLITLLVAQVEVAHGNELLARGHLFWFKSLEDPTVRKEFDRLGIGPDIDSVFKAHFGLPLDEFFLIATVLYFGFLEKALERPITPALIDRKKWPAGVFDDEQTSRVFGLLSMDADHLIAYLLGTPRQSWATDESPLRRYPLIEVYADHCACPDLSYFRLFFLDGIFWLLDDVLNSREWRKFFGTVFEWYVNRIIESFAVPSSILTRTYFRSPRFKGTNDQVCDGLFQWTHTAALCEFKGVRFSSRQRSGVEVEDTIRAIEASIANKDKGVGQLAKALNRIYREERVVSGNTDIHVLASRRIIPVIVWYEESCGNHALRNYLQEKFNQFLDEAVSSDARIGPLVLFTLQDIELFEELTAIESAETLLTDYAYFVRDNPRDPQSPFQVYAHHKFSGREQCGGWIDKELDSFLDRIVTEQTMRVEAAKLRQE